MSATGLEVFDATVQKTNVWLDDLMKGLGWANKHRAYLQVLPAEIRDLWP